MRTIARGFGLGAAFSFLTATAFAQPDALPAPSPNGGGLFEMTLAVKFAIWALLVLLATGFAFLVVFPTLLRKKNPSRPLNAYGLTLGLIWLTTAMLALGIFWDDLALKLNSGSPFVSEWLLRVVLMILGPMGLVVSRTVFRSKVAAAT